MYTTHATRPIEVRFPPSGIFIFESHHGARFYMAPTRKDFLKVVYVLKGSGQIESPLLDRSLPVRQGDLILVSPQQRHAFQDDPRSEAAYIVLCVRTEVLKRCGEDLWRAPRPIRYRNDALAQEADELFRRLFFEQYLRRPAHAEMMLGLTVQLLAVMARARERLNAPKPPAPAARTPREARVHEYLRDLEERYEADEKLDNVAARLGMSRRSFTAFFRKIAGQSWHRYLREVRIRKAKPLLLSDGHTALWVALECGFQDLSTFYRAFRAVEGVTPTQWVNAQRKAPPSPGSSPRAR